MPLINFDDLKLGDLVSYEGFLYRVAAIKYDRDDSVVEVTGMRSDPKRFEICTFRRGDYLFEVKTC